MKNCKIKSYCKVNLSLRVLKKLKNGYHNIMSLITFCDLHDVISISETNLLKDKISFSGRFGKDIKLDLNTVTKVLHYLRKKKFLKKRSFSINIKKNIQARYVWKYVLSLDATEQKLKENINHKLIFGITKKL